MNDTCGFNNRTSTVNTILLNGKDNFNLTNNLNWNAFEIEFGTVTEYKLWLQEANDWLEIDSFDPNTFSTQVDTRNIESNGGNFCYRIEAIYDINLPTGFSETLSSNSNNFCIGQSSRIFAPNAFRPNGVNPEFKPVLLYPNPDGYRLVVLNRWGELLYETNDPDDGWDGTIGTELAPQGVYAYVIKMKSLNGSEIEKKGTVLLLR